MRTLRWRDRADAGRDLGAALRDALTGDPQPGDPPLPGDPKPGDPLPGDPKPGDALPGDTLLLGLPRGGAVVAAAAAAVCGLDWDVWLVRKLGHPAQPELALGALAEGGEPVWDPAAPEVGPLVRDRVAQDEAAELRRRRALYRGDGATPDLRGRTVVVVDDGLATGSTARAACRSVRAAGAARVVVAAPVGSPEAVHALAREADDVVVLSAPRGFRAVGSWYDDFAQTSDAEVLVLLAARSV